MKNCIFCDIIAKKYAPHIIHEDTVCLGILDIHPVQPGHALLIPKQHIDKFYDAPDDVFEHMMGVAKRIAPAIERAAKPKRVALAIAGLGVAHMHIHLVPMHSEQDMTSKNILEGKIANPSSEELKQMCKKICSAIQQL